MAILRSIGIKNLAKVENDSVNLLNNIHSKKTQKEEKENSKNHMIMCLFLNCIIKTNFGRVNCFPKCFCKNFPLFPQNQFALCFIGCYQ